MLKIRNRWILFALPVAGAAVLWQFSGHDKAAQGKTADAVVPVTVALAARHDVPVYLEGVGAIQAYRSVSIHSQVDGTLLQANFIEGQPVRAGDLLGQIDPRSYRAALDQVIAKKAQDVALLTNARSDVQRNASLQAKNYTSQQAFDALRAKAAQLEAAVQGDEAAIEAARIQLDYTAIRSPIEGRAGIRQIDPGNILHGSSSDSSHSASSSSTSDVLVVITQMHPISVLFTLNQDDLPRLVAAQAHGAVDVAVFGRNDGAALDQGRLEVIDNQVDPTTGMVRLKATLPNTNDHLWPGQFVTARLLLETRPQAVTVPATAVQRGAQGDSLFVAKGDGSVEQRKVVTGTVNGETAEILQGVAEGETVVTAGHYRLRPGIKVAANLAPTSSAKAE